MEQTLRAPFAGVLKMLKCKVGDIVGEGVEFGRNRTLRRTSGMRHGAHR